MLDDCGVCDGDHASCNKAITLSLMLPTFNDALALSDPEVDTAFRWDALSTFAFRHTLKAVSRKIT